MFTDESKFNLKGSDGRRLIRCRPGDELKPENIRPTTKFGGGSVMVWGLIDGDGTGPLVRVTNTMDA